MRLLPLMLLVVCCSASAGWQSFMKTVDGKHLFIDLDTLQKSTYTRRIWVLENYAVAAEDGTLSTTSFVEIDCSEKKSRLLQQYWHTSHFGEGENITPDFGLKSDWRFPAPRTGLYEIVITLCKK